jgi:hypothetical protein
VEICAKAISIALKALACEESMPYNAEYMKKAAPTKVTIAMEGKTIEVSGLSVQEIKELIGMNGHANIGGRATRVSSAKSALPRTSNGEPDYIGFRKALTEKGKKFIDVLKQHPNGMQADELVEKMGYESPTQIGGTAGGGMSRIARNFNVDLDNVYTRETTFKNGIRQTVYKPGKHISNL